MLPLIFDAFHEITNSSNPLKMRMIGISYKVRWLDSHSFTNMLVYEVGPSLTPGRHVSS